MSICCISRCGRPTFQQDEFKCRKCLQHSLLSYCDNHLTIKIDICYSCLTRENRLKKINKKSASYGIETGTLDSPLMHSLYTNSTHFPHSQKNIDAFSTYSPQRNILSKKLYIKKEIERISQIPSDKLVKNVTKLEKMINVRNSLAIRSWIQTFLESFQIWGREKNELNKGYDPSNDIFGIDIMYLCYEKIMKTDYLAYPIAEKVENIKRSHIRDGRFNKLIEFLATIQ